MNTLFKTTASTLAVALGTMMFSLPAVAEDIDIFTGMSAGASDNPNILIVLDNTSNWARQNQKWPGGLQQGQAEANAIKTVIQSLGDTVNVGLMEFVTGGNANDNGGFIRYAISPMSASNQTAFSTQLVTIYNNVTSPDEKRNSNTPYGNLMYDAYNYYAGASSYSPTAVLASLADSNGYTTNYTRFKSPLSLANSCARSYIIFIGNPNASGPASDDAANTARLSALGGNTSQMGLPNFTSGSSTSNTTLGATSQCFASSAAANTNDYTSQCAGYTNGCSIGAAVASAGPASCASGTLSYSVIKSQSSSSSVVSVGPTTTNSGTSTTCYSNISNARNGIEGAGTDRGGMTCPATTVVGNVTTTYTCSYAAVNTRTRGSCSANRDLYGITQTVSSTITTVTANPPTQTTLGYTSQCYASQGACSTADYAGACSGTGVSCSCGTPTASTTSSCAAGTSKYNVIVTDVVIANVPTGTTSPDTGPRNADEWARFMYQNGVPLSGSDNKSITTYTIDVYNAQPNATQTSLLMNMARAGGGKYFSASNEAAIVAALKNILVEIQAVNSTFASTSLPVNATNRSQNENQVFIGMFRPDPDANPRWFGNMKRYQLVNSGGNIELGDVNGNLALNTGTGFLTACATSYWTNDSGNYWENVVVNPSPVGTCSSTSFNRYSDAPDGPLVEKGAVAEILRQGNNPPSTSSSPTWAVNRTVYTQSGSSLTAFNTSSSGLSTDLVDFILGKDVNDEKGTGSTTTTRPSIHGDVIHSRPLPINYGGTTGVTVFYGANDGMFRAVNADTGKERWAFVAPEFFSRLDRLRTNSPMVNYPNLPSGITPTPTSKDYFFDGSTGVYQNADSTKVWVYPSMRRGGRMLYGIDVSSPDAPAFKWKAGCPNLNNDTGCTSGMSGIGQTWSLPNVAFIKGYSTTTPVIAVGGGYDACEDSNTSSPSCGSTKGNVIYFLNADTGAIITSFNTIRSVVADIAYVDIDGDGYPDYAYAADTGGNIYRINFINNPTNKTPLSSINWTSHRAAYTAGAGRKFQFAPAVFSNSGKVYVAIGSGDREHPLQTDYPYTDVVNRFYVFMDDLATSTTSDLDSLLDYTTGTTCNTLPVLPNSGLKGWFMTLNQYGQGEQVVTSALIVSGAVTFSTNRPVTSAMSCSSSLGEARGYWVNLFNASGAIGVAGTCEGTRSSTFTGGGLPATPVLATSVRVGAVNTSVVIGAVQKDSTANSSSPSVVSTSPSSTIGSQETKPPIASKRKRVYSYTKGDN